MKVAVQGCLHGELKTVYQHLADLKKHLNEQLDLLIICGDFQSMRHQQDLDDMHCPEKYKAMGTFHEYFEGTKIAPIPTIFIGGNHEAVNSLRESHFGGWVAPNIYFLGQAGSVIVRKGKHQLRISGLSGIYNSSDFKYSTRLETFPLKRKDKITAYHTKQIDIFRLELLSRIGIMKSLKPKQYGEDDPNIDIMLSHDWPQNIALFGQSQELYKVKPFFQKEIEAGTLGSPPLLRLLQTGTPNYWFSAHMHVKYPAIYPHPNNQYTHFLSLDKCQGQRSCLQVLRFIQKGKPIEDFDNQEEGVRKQENISGESKRKEENNKQGKQPIQSGVRIEIDPIWMAVLLLTRNMMRGGDNLYYFDKKDLKITNISLMNEMIKAYPAIREQVQKIGPFEFNPHLTQQRQTAQLLQTLGIQMEELEGLCFQRTHHSLPPNDEIDLDL